MKVIELYGKRIKLFDSFIALGTPEPYINVSPSGLTFEYESGLTHTFNIMSNTGYTITPSDVWIGVNHMSGSQNLTVTVEMLSDNLGLVSRQGTITIENITLSLSKVVTITQNYDYQPLLYIKTKGDVFDGELV